MLNHYRTMELPALLVAGDTIRSWRRIGLEPDELRKPYELESDKRDSGRRAGEFPLPLRLMELTNPGYPQSNLSELGEDPDALSAEVVTKLSPIASLRKIWVDEDAERGLLTLRATLQNGEEVSARGLSDGTLRYLALVLLGLGRGTMWYVEEPENGIHPLRFADLAELLLGLATDLSEDITSDLEELGKLEEFPLRQVIVNTHSSELVREIFERSQGDLLMATTALISGPEQHSARVLRLHPIRETWRCREGERGVMLPLFNYLDATALDAATTEEG
ncbi:AAA family ATPase [Enhygromyxa salina]|nr:AAA family ATPase [Enhygromyxa salina]